jgi:hypothetical protein
MQGKEIEMKPKVAVPELNAKEISALNTALDDEYRAWATYDQVIRDFGAARPFISIRDAEARHIKALHTLFARYGLAVPENAWLAKIARYGSLQEACEAGVAAEIANGAMYDRLLGATERPDLLRVFINLQEASQLQHLPAFQRCAQGAASSENRHGTRHRIRGGRP